MQENMFCLTSRLALWILKLVFSFIPHKPSSLKPRSISLNRIGASSLKGCYHIDSAEEVQAKGETMGHIFHKLRQET